MATTTLDPRDHSSSMDAIGGATLRESARFEHAYQLANRQIERVPWARGEAHPALIAWLNSEGPCHVRPGCRVAVVGCGLGDDAVELLHRGFDVTAFDCAPTAVDWACERHPEYSDCFQCADVCEAPSRWRHRFDLVIDVNNIPWIDDASREDYIASVVDLLHPNGALLLIAAGADPERMAMDEECSPLAVAEALRLVRPFGLMPSRELDDFADDGDPPQRWIRGCFRLRR